MRQHVEHALAFELAQRLADRHVAHVAQRGEVVDLEALAGTQLAVQDAPPQIVGDAHAVVVDATQVPPRVRAASPEGARLGRPAALTRERCRHP